MSQSTSFNVQNLSGSRVEHPVGNEHVALIGKQRSNYNFNYKVMSDQPNLSTTTSRLGFDKGQYYCDHCRMHGHSIQRCYKVHGYPPGHKLHGKGRRVVVVAQTEPSNSHTEVVIPPVATLISNQFSAQTLVLGLITDQYAQLMALLHKQASESSDITHTGFMASNKICLFYTIAKNSWIIDSGTSDHITPGLSLFVHKQPMSQPSHIIMSNGHPAKIQHIGSV